VRRKDVRALPHGIYRVYWRHGGGTSIAAVGSTQTGDKWLAPLNWLSPAGPQAWLEVERVEIVWLPLIVSDCVW
jgi:hypothetical protein